METFPIPGFAFNLKRFEKAPESAFMVKVQKMPAIDDNLFSKYLVDTVFLNDSPDYIQKVDNLEVNCILPLLNPTMHSKIAPIFETRLFKLMMTFNVMGNIDRVDDNAYLSLLSTVYLWCLDNYEHREMIAKMILKTLHVLYASKGKFYELVNDMEKDCSKFFLNPENKRILSIVFVAVDYMAVYRKFEKDDQEEVLEKVWLHYFAKRLSEKSTTIQKLVTFNFEKHIIEGFLEQNQGKKILENYWTSAEILRDVNKKFSNKDFNITFDDNTKAYVNENGLKEDIERKVCWVIMKIWHKKVMGAEIDSDKIIAYIAAAISFNKLEDKAIASVSDDIAYNNQVIANYTISDCKNVKNTINNAIMLGIMGKAKSMYFNAFQDCHMNVKPLSWSEIEEYCKENKMDASKINYNSENMLVINACQSRDCPHFLKVNSKRLRDHLGGWQEKLPRGFHMYVNNHLSMDNDQILKNFMKEKNIDDLSKFGSNTEEALEYVKMVKESYIKQSSG